MTKKKKACIIKVTTQKNTAFPLLPETLFQSRHSLANDYTIKDNKCQGEKQNLMCGKKIILINR